MSYQRETTITRKLVDILEKMRHRWDIEVEVNAFTESGGTLDAIVIERGREPVGIEAKFATTTNATKLIEQAESRFANELETEYRTLGKTLNNVLTILYPDEFKEVAGRNIERKLRKADDFQYKLVTRKGQFPQNGWVKGGVTDIASALCVGATPTSHLEKAVDEMEISIDTAANLIGDAITERSAIGSAIEQTLHQAVFVKDRKIPHQEIFAKDKDVKIHVQTLRMAALIITDAFVFQSALAGKKELGLGTVRSLGQLLSPANAPLQTASTSGRASEVAYADVVVDWNTILGKNYSPIFKDARELVEAIATDDILVQLILTTLCEAAKNLVDAGLAQIHELAGMVFQRLITDRRYIKANYTLPTSATLLSALVLPELPEGKLPKIADFACGTGALLSGVYQRLLMLYEQQGQKNGRDIHRQMLEENIGGADVMPNATHLTAALLASTNADVKIGKTRILTAPYGKQEDDGNAEDKQDSEDAEDKQDKSEYAIGSLELLYDTLSLPTMGTEAEQLGGEGNRIVELQREFPYGTFDIVIQNPPFTRPGADPAGVDGPKSPFQGRDRPAKYKKAMQAALREKNTSIANGLAGLSSYFVELADRMLKPNGTIGVILPLTVLGSPLTQTVRDMLATQYHKVVVITIAGTTGYASAFSADTNMRECIIVATKGKGQDTGRGKFVSLNQRPASSLEAIEIFNRILKTNSMRTLEDPPPAYGGDILSVGEDIAGQLLNCPLPLGKIWTTSCVKSMALHQSAHRLTEGTLQAPMQATSVKIPMCCVSDMAQLGFADYRRAFQMVKGTTRSDGYLCLWNANSQEQRAMVCHPDSRGIPLPNGEKQVQKRVERTSRAHYNMMLRWTANSVISLFTEEPTIGVNTITNVAFENPRYEIPFTLWCNSTLGLLCHWIHSGKQQGGRGLLSSLFSLRTLPTLDVRQLSEEALTNAETIFERLKYERMLPLNKCADDKVRHELDAALVTKVLGIQDVGVLASMQTLREILCAEPSIQAGKQSKCDLEKELRALAKKGIVLPG